VRVWIAAWRQRTAAAQAPAQQPMRTPPTLQQDMATAISQAGAFADAGSQADEGEESMRAARKGVPMNTDSHSPPHLC